MRPATLATLAFVMRKVGMVPAFATIAYTLILLVPALETWLGGVDPPSPPMLPVHVIEVEDPGGRLARVWDSHAEDDGGVTVGLVRLFPHGASGVSPVDLLVLPPTGGPARWVSQAEPDMFVAATVPLAVRALLDDAVRIDAGLGEGFLFGGPVLVEDMLPDGPDLAPPGGAIAALSEPVPPLEGSSGPAGLVHAILMAMLIGLVQMAYEQTRSGSSYPSEVDHLHTHALLEHQAYAWAARAVISLCGMVGVWSYTTGSGQQVADVPWGEGAGQVVLAALVLGGLIGLHRVVTRLDDACVQALWQAKVREWLVVLTFALGHGTLWFGLPTDGVASWALGLLPGVGIGHAVVMSARTTSWAWAGVVLVHAVGIEFLGRWLARDELRARDLWSRLDRAIDRLLPSRFAVGVPDES